MAEIIEDGHGTGNKLAIDDHGRAATKSITVSHLSHHATYHKNCYMGVYDTVLAGTSDTICAMLYNNSSSKDLEIYSVSVSSDANVKMTVKVGETYTSGGVVVELVNSNRSSTAAADVLSYEGGPSANMVVGTGDSKMFCGAHLGASRPFRFSYEGAVVLTPKTGIQIYVKGASTNDVRVTFAYAEHATGTKL